MLGKTTTLAMALVWLTIIVSCAPASRSPGTSALSPNSNTSGNPAPASGGMTAQGTADSGGGNTLKGKPIESYAVKLGELTAFKSAVLPVIEGFKHHTELHFAVETLLKHKIWYLIPGKLDTLPKEKIGAAIATDQAALQDFKQVWINSEIYGAMSAEDQGRLLLHEILIGLRILKFDSPKEECLRWSQDQNESCGSYSNEVRGKPSDLTPDDYAQVRASGVEMFEKYKEWSQVSDKWDDLLYRYGYGGFLQFVPVDANQMLEIGNVQKMIEDANTIGIQTPYGYDWMELLKLHPDFMKYGLNPPAPINWKSTYACVVSVGLKDHNFSAQIDSSKGKAISNFTLAGGIRFMAMKMNNLNGKPVTRIDLRPDLKKYRKGQIFYETNLEFSQQRLSSITLNESVCLADGCDEQATKDGSKFFCSAESSVTIQKRN